MGAGSPTQSIQLAFIFAWGRNGFNRLVADPFGNVTKYGSAGLIQQFPGASNPAITLALVKPDTTDNPNVFQVQASMFAYYTSVGVGTAGYPTDDTLNCPATPKQIVACQWQPFNGNYVLFVWASAPVSGGPVNFTLRDPFYTKWTTFGGMSGLGPANTAETQVTSIFKSVATAQTYLQGAIYNITSGTYSGRLLAVKQPVYDLYVANGGATGPLGLPISEELVLTNGQILQNFEAGAIQYDPATGIAILRPPISRISLTPNGAVHLNTGDTLTAAVSLFANDGTPITDRSIAWNTSNGRAVQIKPNGLTATLTAVGAGTANISATGDGKTSSLLTITVTTPCCQIGEGTPTLSLQQAFQDAVARNHLSVVLPAATPAVRLGNGYIQQLTGTGASATPYLLAEADGSVSAYLVTGALLARYQDLGGPTGALGYPLSDASTGGRQLFQQGALAGNPIQVVGGAILTKWAGLGYESGTAGSPTGASAPFTSFRGTTGNVQTFQNAWIVATGSTAYAISGIVMALYSKLSGPGGDLGAPTTDERTVGSQRQQDFEGGLIVYPPASGIAVVAPLPRQPLVTAVPSSVLSGAPVHLTVSGFSNGATLRISQTGQPDFAITAAAGSYSWDVVVPASTASGSVTVTATDTSSSTSAKVTYAVLNAASASFRISAASGDLQNGAPGALLARPLVALVQDLTGNPVPGQTVTFAASPGAQITPASAVTGADGRVSATLRLPPAESVALATAQVGRQLVTFSAKAGASSLANFPALTQAVDGTLGNGNDTIRQKGALLTAAAAIVRYYQSLNQVTQPNGPADPIGLNQFLKTYCVSTQLCDGFISPGQSGDQIVNLWRLRAFVAGSLDVRIETPTLANVRDLVAAGSPVLLALSLTNQGPHFVVATGIAADGGITIMDPAALQTSLSAYLNQGALTGVVRLLPQPPLATGFLVASTAATTVSSVSGPCGDSLAIPVAQGSFYMRFCDGLADMYQLDATAPGTLTDLSAGGAATPFTTSSLVAKGNSQWVLGRITTNVSARGIVNAASFTADVAPGGLISIYGYGLGSSAQVQVNNQAAQILATTPFQINAQIPAATAAGNAALGVTTPSGTVLTTFTVAKVAPAIFSIGANQAAVVNQDNSLNSPMNPASRGNAIVIYATGFGAVTASGKLSVAATPVTAVIAGTEIPTAFAGLTPGFIGLYQANVVIPANLAPGLTLPLYLKQGTAVSNTVSVAIQ